jgi:hypothetical protein
MFFSLEVYDMFRMWFMRCKRLNLGFSSLSKMSLAKLKSHVLMVTSWGTGQTLGNTGVLQPSPLKGISPKDSGQSPPG